MSKGLAPRSLPRLPVPGWPPHATPRQAGGVRGATFAVASSWLGLIAYSGRGLCVAPQDLQDLIASLLGINRIVLKRIRRVIFWNRHSSLFAFNNCTSTLSNAQLLLARFVFLSVSQNV